VAGRSHVVEYEVRIPALDVTKKHRRKGATYASGMVSFVSMSWRMTTLLRPKYAVGPWGRWHTIRPSGSPRCSWRMTRSVT
jgi:hypothetical protein